MDISIIVPLFNEAESLPHLYEWIARVMKENKFSYEIIFVNDGSTDDSWKVICQLKEESGKVKDGAVHGICFRRNYGKSAALYCGFKAAQGDVVITMDADLQDSPDEIPELYRMITEEGYDLVSGWKQKRYDNALTKNLPSKLFNATARRVTGIQLHDMNCGLKAYRKEVVKNIEVFSEMHRYIPFLAKNAGFTKIGEKVVQHRKREFGTSKFGLNRFVNGYLDLMTKEMHHLFQFLQTVGTDRSLMVDELIDRGASLEEVADYLRCSEIIVHGVVALLAELCYHLLGLSIALGRRLNTLQVIDGVHQFLQSLLCSLERLVGEVDGAAIVG